MNYQLLNQQLTELSRNIDYDITVLANASALIYDALDNLNWCGFYIFTDGVLKLGPFQGHPACTKIMRGHGVCGTAVAENRTILVHNVHKFPGHIACDSASNSEIVIPLHKGNALYAVLDIDSPILNRFTEEDRLGLELLARTLEETLNLQEA